MTSNTVRLAAIHASPSFLDPTATTAKAISLISTAAAQGANLVVFPESFIPGFPVWAGVLAAVDSGPLFARFAAASIYADGPELADLRAAASQHSVALSMGFSERSRASTGCLWNSNVLIDEHGSVLAHHRKLCPTYWEKLVWAPGDGFGLRVCETRAAGRVGMLICGENTNPLARYSLMAQREQVHVASFPPVWPTKREGGYANRTANAVRGAAHSFEAKCFSVVCAGVLGEEALRVVGEVDEEARKVLEAAPKAVSCFFGPDAAQIGDVVGESGEEGIAYAVVDLDRCVEAKMLHDVVGGYQRYDVFELKVTRRRDEPVEFR